ncbi:flagellar basal body-associated protein FliL [compost metagenome]
MANSAKQAAAKKPPSDSPLNGKVIMAAVGIALISSLSSFVAIRFAMPKQVIIEKHVITEKGKVVEDKGHEEKQAPATEIYPVGEFIVNLSDPGRHYLKTTVALAMVSEAHAEGDKKGGGGHGGGNEDPSAAIKAAMAAYEPLYKDAIISTLSRQSIARLKAPGGRDLIKDELKVTLNRIAPDKKVMGVYFTDFVIQ